MNSINTHHQIDQELSGKPVELSDGFAQVELLTTEAMRADERGLVHGGFIFSLADYAAMLAVNDPNVVLGAAETRFLAPVEQGQTVVAKAQLKFSERKKRIVQVQVSREQDLVFEGSFTCFVLPQHVLDQGK